jgi:hypothetical protein
MEYKMISPEEYQEQLFEEYNKQKREDLIMLCKSAAMAAAEANDEFMNSVLQVVLQSRNITFQQWKAMKVFTKKHNQKKYSKQF